MLSNNIGTINCFHCIAALADFIYTMTPTKRQINGNKRKTKGNWSELEVSLLLSEAV